jgi:hypothetical protein
LTIAKHRRSRIEARGDGAIELARIAGSVAGYIGRRRELFESISLAKDFKPGIAFILEQVLAPLATIAPSHPGRRRLQELSDGGTVRLIVAAVNASPVELGRRYVALLMAWRLVVLAVTHKGGHVVYSGVNTNPDAHRFLDAALSSTNRRVAQRLLASHSRRLGLRELHVDFAATYRTGRASPIQTFGQQSVRLDDLRPRDAVLIVLLFALIFACDCWCLKENPINVAYLALIKLGNELWETGSEAFREAMTESLVVATMDTIPPGKLSKLDRFEKVAILEGDAIAWAGAVVLAYQDMHAHSLIGFRLLRFLKDLTNKAKRHERWTGTEDHLIELGHRVLNLDETGFDLADNRTDPGIVIPEVYYLRDRIRQANLTRREKQVLALRLRDMPFDRIGKELGMSPSSARVLMYRVRRAAGPSAGQRRNSRRAG